MDSQINRVLTELENQNMLNNTIIIISSDHGQEFNENKKNYWGHGSNFSKWQLEVPLIVYYPSIEAGKTFSHMTTHYDISATLLKHFMGVENPATDISMGYDLYDTNSRYPHIIGSIVNFGFIFENSITSTNHLGTLEITDRELNELPRSALDVKQLQTAIEKKNHFYKK